MTLREEIRRRRLEDRAIYVKEACDKCGQLLGAVRFTRKDDPGVWCSRECRDGAGAHEPGTFRHCKANIQPSSAPFQQQIFVNPSIARAKNGESGAVKQDVDDSGP